MASAGRKSAAKRTSVKRSAAAKETGSRKSAAAKPAAKKSSKKPADKSTRSATAMVDEQLARYRSMRDFHITAEPAGTPSESRPKDGSTQWPFCVQKHAASHLHYDFRLGWNGVLKSWAVAKGPSYVVADKRLAVQVEDHPIEYGGFEGIIPKGQYGGGTVMLWDQGTWEPQPAYPDVDEGLRKGSLKFILHGTKLQGKWALIRMHGRSGGSESKPNWLLIKEHDDYERPASDPGIAESEPNSVVTGRTMDEIARSEDHVWNSKETGGTGQAWYSQESKAGATASSSSKTASVNALRSAVDLNAAVASLPKETQPEFLSPQLAQQADAPPANDGWLHELKLDGYRIQARKSGPKVQLLTRKGLDWTHRMRSIADAVATIPAASATLDGEVVVLRENGTTSFADLQASFQEGAKHGLTYFCFDLLHLNGRNPRDLPLTDRKALLEHTLTSADPSTLRYSEHIAGNGEAIFRNACKMHAEGIISKLAKAKYSAGRSSDWIKCKCLLEQEFVIGGFSLPSAGHIGMHGVGSLALGYYQDGKLIYAGRTGTGFNQKTHKLLRDRLDALTQTAMPFDNPPAEARRGMRWVKPELVAQVRFATWTADYLVRQAAFVGLREDKPAAEVTREVAAPMPKSATGRSRGATVKSAPAATLIKAAASTKPATTGRAGVGASPTPVRLTHPEKILDEQSHLTKRALADYYWAVAPTMLPHIAGRPLSLVRCPEGSGKPCFFQKHVNHMLPPGIGGVEVPNKKTGAKEVYITLDSAEALAGLAQMGVLEIHPWGSRNDNLEHPDRLIFDLDPDESLPWSTVTEAAAEVRARLKKIGLASFLKTTGGKGLHIIIPIEPQLDWPHAKDFAHRFVLAMERSNPKLYLTKMTKAARAGKIYLDYLRNERGATAVAPLSPRARAGAPVSMPLAWSELNSAERPVFYVANFEEWRERLAKNPWKAMLTTSQKLNPDALKSVA